MFIRNQAQSRGTHAGNPNQGRLAGQLAANKAAKPVPETRQEEQRLVVRVSVNFLRGVVMHELPFTPAHA